MTREAIPLAVPDVGTFARSLGRALDLRSTSKPEPPGHVELLNLLARAAGHRSYQGLRAASRMPRAARWISAWAFSPRPRLGRFTTRSNARSSSGDTASRK